ncbi:nuclease-related domain-containing protein [Yeosuana sp.]|uniref:nuclease-related domain-containing protein n=1 Tax=Yeosuana sp. TaxID=2529388 RepID=UPI004049BC73
MWYATITLALLLIYFLYKNRSRLSLLIPSKRGSKSERKLVSMLKKYGLPTETIFHDLYLQVHNDYYSQIDLVVPTKIGMLVFEVKEYSGWIFGSGDKKNWVQILNFGQNKYYFYNPILQNEKHILNLKKQLSQFENVPFFSFIVFFGNCTLKEINKVPENTFVIKSDNVEELLNKIINDSKPTFYSNKLEIIDLLTLAVKNGESKEIVLRHGENLKKIYG